MQRCSDKSKNEVNNKILSLIKKTPREIVIKFRLDLIKFKLILCLSFVQLTMYNVLVKYLSILDLRKLKKENRLISKSLTTENMSEWINTEPTENRGNTL